MMGYVYLQRISFTTSNFLILYRALGKYLTIDLLESSRRRALAKIRKTHEALKVAYPNQTSSNQMVPITG